MRRFLAPLILLALPAAASAQAPALPGGGSLLDWMGLEPGDTRVLAIGEERLCVTVEETRTADGRAWAELRGLRWPGLASDSRVLVPLDGSIGLSVIATPGPRPVARPLLPSSDTLRFGTPGAADGWYATGPRDDPERLVYVWCSVCSDAGSRVVLERGRGIRSVTTTTIAGTETLTAVDDSLCAERPESNVELQIYVLPDDGERP